MLAVAQETIDSDEGPAAIAESKGTCHHRADEESGRPDRRTDPAEFLAAQKAGRRIDGRIAAAAKLHDEGALRKTDGGAGLVQGSAGPDSRENIPAHGHQIPPGWFGCAALDLNIQ